MNVWVVTYGEYSSTRVVAVLSDEAEANRIAGLHKSGNAEGFELDKAAYRPRDGEGYHVVEMRANGEVNFVQRAEPRLEPAESRAVWQSCGFDAAKAAKPMHQIFRRALVVHCWASSEQHAIKIANEHRLQHLANDDWRKLQAVNEDTYAKAKLGMEQAGREYPYTFEHVHD